MAETQFEDCGVRAGIWQGRLTGAPVDRLTLVLDGQVVSVAEAEAEADGDGWRVAMPLPPHVLGQGSRVVLLMGEAQGVTQRLGALTMCVGTSLDADAQAEIALLRSEMDMLKQVVRQLVQR